MATKILDFSDDGGALVAACRNPELLGREIVASARRPDFALVADSSEGELVRYPIHTKTAALRSAIYFSEYHMNVPENKRGEVKEKIASALDAFGQRQAADSFRDLVLLATNDRELSMDELADFVTGTGRNDSERLFDALNKLSAVEKVAAVRSANGQAAGLSPDYGSTELDYERADSSILVRQNLLTQEQRGAYEPLRLKIASRCISVDDAIRELAAQDSECGLTFLYGTMIDDAARSVLKPLVEKAAEVLLTCSKGSFPASKLVACKHKIAQAFGSDVSESVLASEHAYESLPNPVKEAIYDICRQ